MENLVILTPTFNRAKNLPMLYNSLKKQRDSKFKWVIIDDGSEDNTKQLVEEMIEEKQINIDYHFQSNGGKARALNKGFSLYKNASAFMIVDSDDYLLNTGTTTVKMYIKKYIKKKEIGAFFFHYNTTDGKVLNPNEKKITKDYILTPYDYNKKFGKHDGCICFLNQVVKKYRFPDFPGEKYVGPTVLQMKMTNEYKILYSPKVVGVAEYQEGGLTKSGRTLRIKNPLGMIYYSGLLQSKQAPLKVRIKNSIGAQAYRFFSKRDQEELSRFGLSKYLHKWAFIPGLILKLYWQFKY